MKCNMIPKIRKSTEIERLGNIYPSNGQNGDIVHFNGVSPCLRSGQGQVGRGIGSCNAPKILIEYT